MSFAKNQEEEVTSVPGVRYTDDTNNDEATSGIVRSNGRTHSNVRYGGRERSRTPSLDVEMGRMGDARTRGESPDEAFAEEEEIATFV